MAELVKKYDKDGDGRLNDVEKLAARADFEKLRHRHAAAKGSRVSASRAKATAQEFMKRFDKDGDGKLNDAERAAAKAEFGNRGPGGDKPGPKPKQATSRVRSLRRTNARSVASDRM